MRTLRRPLFIGIAGIQGSGKSTQTKVLQSYLESQFGMTTCALSIDDFYKDQTQRTLSSERIHPLLKTRGVPGTHHVDAIHSVFDALAHPQERSSIAIPCFDKSTDNPKPIDDWRDQALPVDVVIFEGWCVGAQSQAPEDLNNPINQLEQEEDPKGVFRNYVNKELREKYEPLWKKLDTLVWLHPPTFEMVYTWRKKQEEHLKTDPNQRASKKMNDADLKRFIMHYERISRHMMATMPQHADWVIYLNDDQSPKKVTRPREC